MPVAELKLYFDNTPATQQQLGLFADVRVDRAIGMAAQAELHMSVGVDASGVWSGIDEDYTQPFTRVRVEVKLDADFVALIDGPIVGQRFDLSAGPNESRLVLVVQDDSVLLNQDEAVELYEEMTADAIASQLFAEAGLTSRTDSVNEPAGGLEHYLVRRGTAMQFLKQLARRHGMFLYVEPDSTPGASIGYFVRPDLSGGEYPELLMMGANRNINRFSARFDGLRPLKARADSVEISDKQDLSSEVERSDIDALGDQPAHDIVPAGITLMARTREAQADLDSATVAAVNHSSWAYSASAEVISASYAGVLLPYRVVSVAGAGASLSGDWLISRVTHSINDSGYRQAFTLQRNARSAGAGAVSVAGIF